MLFMNLFIQFMCVCAYVHLYIYKYMRTCPMALHMEVKRHHKEVCSLFYHMGHRDQTQVNRIGGKGIHNNCHLTSPLLKLLWLRKQGIFTRLRKIMVLMRFTRSQQQLISKGHSNQLSYLKIVCGVPGLQHSLQSSILGWLFSDTTALGHMCL